MRPWWMSECDDLLGWADLAQYQIQFDCKEREAWNNQVQPTSQCTSSHTTEPTGLTLRLNHQTRRSHYFHYLDGLYSSKYSWLREHLFIIKQDEFFLFPIYVHPFGSKDVYRILNINTIRSSIMHGKKFLQQFDTLYDQKMTLKD